MPSRRLSALAAITSCCAVGLIVAAGVRHGATAVVHLPAPAVPRVTMQPCDPTLNMTILDLTGVDRYLVGGPDRERWTETVTWSNGTTTTAAGSTADGSVTFQHPAPYVVDGTTAVHTDLRLSRAGSVEAVTAFRVDEAEPGKLASCVVADHLPDVARGMRMAHVVDRTDDVHPLVDRLVACGVTTAVNDWPLDRRLICATVKLTGDDDPAGLVFLDWSVANLAVPADRFGAVELEPVGRRPPNLLPWRLGIGGCLVVAGAALWQRRRRRLEARAEATWRAIRADRHSASERGP